MRKYTRDIHALVQLKLDDVSAVALLSPTLTLLLLLLLLYSRRYSEALRASAFIYNYIYARVLAQPNSISLSVSLSCVYLLAFLVIAFATFLHNPKMELEREREYIRFWA